MKNKEITLGQIINQPFGKSLETDTHIIQRYDDHPNKWEIYTLDQAEDSDPDPIFKSEDPKKIFEFLLNQKKRKIRQRINLRDGSHYDILNQYGI